MKTASDVKTLAVLGAGTMGSGIAQVAAQAGISVQLQDLSRELAEKGVARIDASLRSLVEKGRMADEERHRIIGVVFPCEDIEAAVRHADVVIEAAPEDMELKKDLFAQVCRVAGPETLIASNTSSLSITDMSEAIDDPGRFLGMHFFNPPPVMKLLEIVRGAETDDPWVDFALALARRLGKEPIVVRDSPGFASSRLGIALGLEAMRMVDEGVASAADIDKAMELGYRHPMGPLKLTDLVGLDVRLAIAEHLAATLDPVRFKPPEILERLVKQGLLGKKTGRGFYRWEGGEPHSY